LIHWFGDSFPSIVAEFDVLSIGFSTHIIYFFHSLLPLLDWYFHSSL